MSPTSIQALSQEEREQVRETVAKASEPTPPFWPLQIMVAQNPMHGLEYLSFDEAVRKGKRLLGGNGYLPNKEYREFYRAGRITADNLERALARVGPRSEQVRAVMVGSREIAAAEVWRLHVVYGFEPLEPALLEWELGGEGATKRFRQDLPDESAQRIIERTIRECEHCRDHPEEAYLTNLWKTVLAALGLSDARHGEQSRQLGSGMPDAARASIDVALPALRTVSDWVDALAGSTIVEQVDNRLIKWLAALVAYWQEHPDEYEQRMSGGARAADPVKQNICRNAWRLFHLAQVLEVSPLEMLDLSPDDAQTLLGWLDAFPPDRHGPVWLEAYEDFFRADIIQRLTTH